MSFNENFIYFFKFNLHFFFCKKKIFFLTRHVKFAGGDEHSCIWISLTKKRIFVLESLG